MKNPCSPWFAITLVMLVGCGGGGQSPAISEIAAGGQTPPAPPGWRISEGPTPYSAESLFEYLNGGAPLYLDYGFRGLTQVRYQMGDDPLACVTLDVYDMGSELGAFGLYRSVTPPGAEVEAWGVEAFRSGTIVAAWRGSFYVHGEADGESPELVEVLRGVVSSAIGAVEGPDALPPVLDSLPRDGLLPGSERYVAADLFGHAFLPGGIIAGYDVRGGQVELFFSRLGGVAEAEDALRRLRAYQEQWGELGSDVTDLGDCGFRLNDPGLGPGMVVRSGNSIVGFHGTGDGDDLVREMVARLPQD